MNGVKQFILPLAIFAADAAPPVDDFVSNILLLPSQVTEPLGLLGMLTNPLAAVDSLRFPQAKLNASAENSFYWSLPNDPFRIYNGNTDRRPENHAAAPDKDLPEAKHDPPVNSSERASLLLANTEPAAAEVPPLPKKEEAVAQSAALFDPLPEEEGAPADIPDGANLADSELSAPAIPPQSNEPAPKSENPRSALRGAGVDVVEPPNIRELDSDEQCPRSIQGMSKMCSDQCTRCFPPGRWRSQCLMVAIPVNQCQKKACAETGKRAYENYCAQYCPPRMSLYRQSFNPVECRATCISKAVKLCGTPCPGTNCIPPAFKCQDEIARFC